MSWKIDGDVFLNCNCDVFCPCVLSLGQAAPSQGYCHSWWGIRIRDGHYEQEDLSGLNIGILLDVPGRMGEGDWSIAIYIPEEATDTAQDAITRLFTGHAGGSLGILRLLVSEVVGVERAPIEFIERDGGWGMKIPKVVDSFVKPVTGGDGDNIVEIKNSAYWVSSDVVVAVGTKSRVRAFGRVWNFDGKSAEYAKVAWSSDV